MLWQSLTDQRKGSAGLKNCGLKGVRRMPETTLTQMRLFSSALQCQLCTGYLSSPWTFTDCLHSFCERCLRLAHDAGAVRCPAAGCGAYWGGNSWNDVLRRDATRERLVEALLQLATPSAVRFPTGGLAAGLAAVASPFPARKTSVSPVVTQAAPVMASLFACGLGKPAHTRRYALTASARGLTLPRERCEPHREPPSSSIRCSARRRLAHPPADSAARLRRTGPTPTRPAGTFNADAGGKGSASTGPVVHKRATTRAAAAAALKVTPAALSGKKRPRPR